MSVLKSGRAGLTDKTGTLTEGSPTVTGIISLNPGEHLLLRLSGRSGKKAPQHPLEYGCDPVAASTEGS